MSRTIVVFDLGNVLVRWDRRFLYGQLIDDPVELDWFLDNVLTLEENAALDRGVPLEQMTANLAQRWPHHADLIDAFRTRWIDTLGPEVEGTVAVLHDLVGRGVSCYALSNWGADTFALVEDRWPWMALFDGLVISGREGVVKPQPEIFELLCERYRFGPGDAVFIDDGPANVATAERLGFEAVLFESANQLREALAALDLL